MLIETKVNFFLPFIPPVTTGNLNLASHLAELLTPPYLLKHNFSEDLIVSMRIVRQNLNQDQNS